MSVAPRTDLAVGDRVTHLDKLRRDGAVLPMAGTVVEVQTPCGRWPRYRVAWDEASTTGGYLPGDLVPLGEVAS